MRTRSAILGAATALLIGCGADSQGPPAGSQERGQPAPRAERQGERPKPAPRRERGYRAFVAVETADAIAVLRGPPWRAVGRLAAPPGPHNATASPDFLSEFPSEELARYLDRLTILRQREQAERSPAYATSDGLGAKDFPIVCP